MSTSLSSQTQLGREYRSSLKPPESNNFMCDVIAKNTNILKSRHSQTQNEINKSNQNPLRLANDVKASDRSVLEFSEESSVNVCTLSIDESHLNCSSVTEGTAARDAMLHSQTFRQECEGQHSDHSQHSRLNAALAATPKSTQDSKQESPTTKKKKKLACHIFPRNDVELKDAYIDNRSEIEILKDIVKKSQFQLKPELRTLYSKMLNRDIFIGEYCPKSFVNKTRQDLRELCTQYKKDRNTKEEEKQTLKETENYLENVSPDNFTPENNEIHSLEDIYEIPGQPDSLLNIKGDQSPGKRIEIQENTEDDIKIQATISAESPPEIKSKKATFLGEMSGEEIFYMLLLSFADFQKSPHIVKNYKLSKAFQKALRKSQLFIKEKQNIPKFIPSHLKKYLCRIGVLKKRQQNSPVIINFVSTSLPDRGLSWAKIFLRDPNSVKKNRKEVSFLAGLLDGGANKSICLRKDLETQGISLKRVEKLHNWILNSVTHSSKSKIIGKIYLKVYFALPNGLSAYNKIPFLVCENDLNIEGPLISREGLKIMKGKASWEEKEDKYHLTLNSPEGYTQTEILVYNNPQLAKAPINSYFKTKINKCSINDCCSVKGSSPPPLPAPRTRPGPPGTPGPSSRGPLEGGSPCTPSYCRPATPAAWQPDMPSSSQSCNALTSQPYDTENKQRRGAAVQGGRAGSPRPPPCSPRPVRAAVRTKPSPEILPTTVKGRHQQKSENSQTLSNNNRDSRQVGSTDRQQQPARTGPPGPPALPARLPSTRPARPASPRPARQDTPITLKMKKLNQNQIYQYSQNSAFINKVEYQTAENEYQAAELFGSDNISIRHSESNLDPKTAQNEPSQNTAKIHQTETSEGNFETLDSFLAKDPHLCHAYKCLVSQPRHFQENKGPIDLNTIRQHLGENYSSQKDRYEKSADYKGLIQDKVLDKINLIPHEKVEVKQKDYLKPNIDSSCPEALKEKFQKLFKKYESTVAAKDKYSIGEFKGFEAQLEVKTKDSTAFQKRRKMPPLAEKGIRNSMMKLFQSGVFGKSTEGASQYCANITSVIKGGDTKSDTKADKYIRKMNQQTHQQEYRAAIDLSSLNSILSDPLTINLPTLEDVLNKTRNCKICVSDIANMFFAIKLSPESRKFVNFHAFSEFGNPEIWTHFRLPQGLSSSPAIAQASMFYTFNNKIHEQFLKSKNISSEEWEKCFGKGGFSSYVIFYFDDLIAYIPEDQNTSLGNTSDLLYLAWESILYALNEAGHIIKYHQTTVHTNNFEFLGHHITTNTSEVSMNDSRIKAITQARIPRNTAELFSRLSTMRFFESYLPLSRLCSLPLIQLTKSEFFYWNKAEAEAWSELIFLAKLNMKNYIFDPNKSIFLELDASSLAGGYAVYQLSNEGKLLLIRCGSKLWSKEDRNSSAVNRELANAIWTLEQVEDLLRNCKQDCFFFTDCSSASLLGNLKSKNPHMVEKSIFFRSFTNLHAFFLKGRIMGLADLISREWLSKKLEQDRSQTFSELVAPLSTKHKNGIILNMDTMSKFLLQSCPDETLDCFFKKNSIYTDRTFDLYEIIDKIHSPGNLSQLVSALSFGFAHPDALKNIPLINRLIKLRLKNGRISKSQSQEILTALKCKSLQKKLEALDIDKTEFTRLTKVVEKFRSEFEKLPQKQGTIVPSKESIKMAKIKNTPILTNSASIIALKSCSNQTTSEIQKKRCRSVPGVPRPGPAGGIQQAGGSRTGEPGSRPDVRRSQSAHPARPPQLHPQPARQRCPPPASQACYPGPGTSPARPLNPPLCTSQPAVSNFSELTDHFTSSADIKNISEIQGRIDNIAPVSGSHHYSTLTDFSNQSVKCQTDHSPCKRMQESSRDQVASNITAVERGRQTAPPAATRQSSRLLEKRLNKQAEYPGAAGGSQPAARQRSCSPAGQKKPAIQPDNKVPAGRSRPRSSPALAGQDRPGRGRPRTLKNSSPARQTTEMDLASQKKLPALLLPDNPTSQTDRSKQQKNVSPAESGWFQTHSTLIRTFLEAAQILSKILPSYSVIAGLLNKYKQNPSSELFINIYERLVYNLNQFKLFKSAENMQSSKETEGSKKLLFLPYSQKSAQINFSLQQDTIVLTTNQNIQLKPLQYTAIDVSLLFLYDGFYETSLLNKTSLCDSLIDTETISSIFHLSKLILFNEEGSSKIIPENTDLVKIRLSNENNNLLEDTILIPFVLPAAQLKLCQSQLELLEADSKRERTLQILEKAAETLWKSNQNFIPSHHSGVFPPDMIIDPGALAAGRPADTGQADIHPPSQLHSGTANYARIFRLIGEDINFRKNNKSFSVKENFLQLSLNLFKANGILDHNHLLNIQKSDSFFNKIITRLENKKNCLDFELLNGVLYKSPSGNNIRKRLCLPKTMIKSLVISLHLKHDLHITSSAMFSLLQCIYFCQDFNQVVQKAHRSCILCICQDIIPKRKYLGERRSIIPQKINYIWTSDIMHLFKDKFEYKLLLILVEEVSQYCIAIPLKSSTGTAVANAFQTFLCCIPPPAFIRVDRASYFYTDIVKTTLQRYDVQLKTSIIRHSNSQSTAEVKISHIRRQLNKSIYALSVRNPRLAWSACIPAVLNIINAQNSKFSKMSKTNLFFSPLFYKNLYSDLLEEELTPKQNIYKIQRDTLSKQMKNKQIQSETNNKLKKITMGSICRYKAAPKTIKEGNSASQHLQPGPQTLYKVVGLDSGGHSCDLISLKDGSELNKRYVGDCEKLQIDDIIECLQNPLELFQYYTRNSKEDFDNETDEIAADPTSCPAVYLACASNSEVQAIQTAAIAFKQKYFHPHIKTNILKKSVTRPRYSDTEFLSFQTKDSLLALFEAANLQSELISNISPRQKLVQKIINNKTLLAGFRYIAEPPPGPASCTHKKKIRFNENILCQQNKKLTVKPLTTNAKNSVNIQSSEAIITAVRLSVSFKEACIINGG